MKWKRNLYILWITQTLSSMSFGFGIPLIPFYIQELGLTDPSSINLSVGILNSAPAVTMAIMSPVWGVLSDRYGRKPMLIRAMVSASVIISLMGLVQNVNQLIVLRAMQGLFTGTVAAASTFVAVSTPKENLSYALGFLSSSTFLGSSLGQALGGLTAESFGNRMTFFIGGTIMVIGVILAIFLLKEDRSTYGKRQKTDTSTMKLKDLVSVVGLLLVMLMMQRFIRSIFDPFMPLYLHQLRGPVRIKAVTGYVRMAISIATALAGLTLTRLGDRGDKRKIIVGLLLITIVVASSLLLFQGFWPFVILFTLMSFFLGGIEPLITSLSAERVDSKNRGLLFGYQGMVASLGWMVAPLAGSFLSISFGGYEVLIVTIIVVLLINFAMSFRALKKEQRKEI